MTKSVNQSCPCCSGANTELMGLQEPFIMLCLDCNCKWHEEKRNRALVAYDYLWECLQNAMDDCIRMFISADGQLCYVRKDWWPGGKSQVFVYRNAEAVAALGWADMPARERQPPQGGE